MNLQTKSIMVNLMKNEARGRRSVLIWTKML